MSDLELDDLRAELDEFSTPIKDTSSKTPKEERIIAGFQDIERFYEQHKRLPTHGEGNDIFERLYAIRLDQIRVNEECRHTLTGLDQYGILDMVEPTSASLADMDDEALLAELTDFGTDLTQLKHVRSRAEIKAAEDIAKRNPCIDFYKFKQLFEDVQDDLKAGIRQSRRFKENAQIHQGEFFILGGHKVYVAEMGEEIKAPNGSSDARLRVIYDNGTESDLLMRSLQRALYKDDAGRRITNPVAGPLFSDETEDGDLESGTIYVLRSQSDHPFIREHKEVIHKIGITGGDVKKRISNAKLDPTFLMADVEIAATYKLSNINRTKLENLIHRFFESARLDLVLPDRLGNHITPREWFLAPIFVIDEVIERIRDGSIVNFSYDTQEQRMIIK